MGGVGGRERYSSRVKAHVSLDGLYLISLEASYMCKQ